MDTKNAAMFAALHRYNLNIAKESIIFDTAKRIEEKFPQIENCSYFVAI